MAEERSGLVERAMFGRIEVWLVAVMMLGAAGAGGAWVFAMLRHDAFPAPIVREIAVAVRGNPADRRSLSERLLSDVVESPRRLRATGTRPLPVDEARLVPVTLAPGYRGPEIETGAMRALPAEGAVRYFLAYGAFGFTGRQGIIGTVLIDSAGAIHRAWHAPRADEPYAGPHIGLAIDAEGRIATNAYGRLTALDWCGGLAWQADWAPTEADHNSAESLDWHHDIEAHGGRFYSFQGFDIVAVDGTDGREVERVTGYDLLRWSWAQDLHILDFRLERTIPRDHSDAGIAPSLPMDPFHLNKIAVLGAEQAAEYPGLEAGDWLVSVRDSNAVIVLRPSTQRIVWSSVGHVSDQHDATFVDGAIEVFNNAPYRLPPRPEITRIDLASGETATVFDLSRWGVEMRRRGNFERRGDRLLVPDADNGRLVAGRLDGTVDFLFENGFDADGGNRTNLLLTAALEIEAGRVAALEAGCGGAE